MSSLFEDIALQFEKATDQDLTAKSYTLDSLSYISREAIRSLEYEPSGSLAVLIFRAAWNEFCQKRSVTIADLLQEDAAAQRLSCWRDLDHTLRSGEPQALFDRSVDLVRWIASIFHVNEDAVNELVADENKFIDILKEATQNIYQKYVVDKFLCADTKTNEPVIFRDEFHFACLQDFVRCLKNSDNCIAYARIDGTLSYGSDTTTYDAFFAFGARIGDHVYINSDREVDANPEARKAKLQRNPSKALRNKSNSTWMPYYSLTQRAQGTSSETALITSDVFTGVSVEVQPINVLYDAEAQLMICVSMAMVYRKYWVEKAADVRFNHIDGELTPVEDSYFSDEVKLLPADSSETALALPGELQLAAPTTQTIISVPNSFYYNKVTYYDWYVKEYTTPEDFTNIVKLDNDFIGTKRDMERVVWWEQRRKALDLVNDRRTKWVSSQYDNWGSDREGESADKVLSKPLDMVYQPCPESGSYFFWSYTSCPLPGPACIKNFDVIGRLHDNMKYIIGLCLSASRGDRCVIYWYRLNGQLIEPHKEGQDRIDHIYDPEAEWSTLSIKTEVNARHQEEKEIEYALGWRDGRAHKEPDGDLRADLYWTRRGSTFVISSRYTKSKEYKFTIEASTFWDLCHLLSCQPDDLPPAWRRWFSNRYCFKPYSGNHLLEMTDPMDKVYDVIDEQFKFNIVVLLSKSEMKTYGKLIGIEPQFPKKDEEV